MKTNLPNWPLKDIDGLTFKTIIKNWLKSILNKNTSSVTLIENSEKIFLEK
jgi:hypothetical protein